MTTNTPVPDSARAVVALGILAQLFQTRVGRLLQPEDLTYSQLTVLSHLARTGSATVSDLAQAIEMNQPGVTKIVQRLSQREWVAVNPDPEDARRRVVTLTEAGGAGLGRAWECLGPDIGRWFEDWSAEDMARFGDGLERLAWWLDDNRL